MWKWMLMLCMAVSATTVYAEKTVLAFSGSSREDSVNQKLVVEAANIARQMGAKVTVVNLKDYSIPLYNADLESKQGMPAQAKEFRQKMLQSDVILIASPEYNGSLSALLKNTIDWASRTEKGEGSREAFKGKVFALMSASPGPSGGAKGLVHLRSILEVLNGNVIPQQVVVPDAYDVFDQQGHLKDEKLKKELTQLVQSALNS